MVEPSRCAARACSTALHMACTIQPPAPLMTWPTEPGPMCWCPLTGAPCLAGSWASSSTRCGRGRAEPLRCACLQHSTAHGLYYTTPWAWAITLPPITLCVHPGCCLPASWGYGSHPAQPRRWLEVSQPHRVAAAQHYPGALPHPQHPPSWPGPLSSAPSPCVCTLLPGWPMLQLAASVSGSCVAAGPGQGQCCSLCPITPACVPCHGPAWGAH